MKKWLKLLLVVAFFAMISVVAYFIMRSYGITNVDTLQTYIKQAGKYAIFTFLGLEIIFFIFLAFVPVLDSALIVLGVVLFGGLKGFIISLIANIVSSSILFFLGDKFGEKLAIKLIGKDELDRTQNYIDKKSKIFLPILFLLPFIPDEALCLIAGMTKMRYLYFIINLITCRAIYLSILCLISSGILG